MRFAKGHGTENDFVILPDPDAALELTPQRVAALCDRRAGIGADGVLRVVRTAALRSRGEVEELPELGSDVEWFMDYRNADGSIAEMCGNGVRVFVRYLVEAGLYSGRELTVGTRAGRRSTTVEADGTVTVNMGPVFVLGPGVAQLADTELPGLRIDVGNPHLAGHVSGPVADIALAQAPKLNAAEFPDGGNVEVFQQLGPGHLDMRVYERGAGETRSCGTGIVAAAVAAAPEAEPAEWRVDVPGGTCTVYRASGHAWLRGPAVLVAEGVVHL